MMLQILTSDMRVVWFWALAKLKSIFSEKINNVRTCEVF